MEPQGNLYSLTQSGFALPRHRPGEKRESGSRVTVGVSIKKVISAGIILVDRFFDQTHTKRCNVEFGISLCITRECRDVMDTFIF